MIIEEINGLLWHLLAGITCGHHRTCYHQGKPKIVHEREQDALNHADSLNHQNNRNRKVEAYPCPFCWNWHVGRAMNSERLSHLASMVGRKQFTAMTEESRQEVER